MAVVASLEAIITASTEGFDQAVDSANQKLQELGQTGGDTAKQLTTSGKLMAGIGAAITAPLIGAVKQAADFEYAMDAVNAALGGVDTSTMDLLEQQALDLGASTKFSAQEIAGVQEQLAKTGLTAQDLLDGATKSVTDLAAATGESLPAATDAASAAMNLFGLQGQDMSRVADILTGTLNQSSASLPDLQRGINSLGSVLQNQNKYLEMTEQGLNGAEEAFIDTAAAVGYFNQQGLKAADAGVSLARGITNLSKPTSKGAQKLEELGIAAFDMNGNFIGIPELMDQLNESMSGMSDQAREAALSTIFGAEAADVMNQAIKKGGDGLREFTENLREEGLAAKQAEIRQGNLTSSVEKLGGALNGLAIQMGTPLLEPIKNATDGVTKMVDALAGAPPEVQKLVSEFAALSGGLLLGGGGLAYGTGKVLELGQAFKAAGLSLPKFAAGLGLVGLAIGAGLLAYETNFLGFADFVDEKMADAGKSIEKFGQTFDEVFSAQKAKGMNDIANVVDSFGKALFDATGIDWLEQTAALGRAIDVLGKSFAEGAAKGIDPWVNALESAGDAARAIGQNDLANTLDDWSLAWGAMADKMKETEGTMPELNRELSALQAGLQQLTGLPVETWFDNIGSEFGRLRTDITPFLDAMGSGADGVRNFFGALTDGDWGGAWDQFTGGIQSVGDKLADVNIGGALQGVSDQMTGWFNDVGDLLMGRDALGPGDKGAVEGLIPQLADNIVSGLSGLGDAVMGGLEDAGGNPFVAVGDWLKDSWESLMGGGDMESLVSGGYHGPGGETAQAMKPLTQSLVDNLSDGLISGLNELGGTVEQKLQTIPNPMDGVQDWLQEGMDEVSRFFQPQEMAAGLGGAGFGDTSGIDQMFTGMLDGIAAALPTAQDVQAKLGEVGGDFMTAIGDNILGPLGQFLFPSQDAIASGENLLGDPRKIGEQFGKSILDTFSDPAFSEGLDASIEALPDEVFQGTGTALLGAMTKGMATAMDQPVEGGAAGETMGQQMVKTLADGLTTSLQAEGAADMLIPAVNAFGSAFNTTLGKAMTSTIMPKGQTGMVGEAAAGGIGGKLVQSLADGLTTSLQTEGTADKFIPAVNALGSVLNTAMQTASQGTQQVDGQDPAGQAATGFGQQMVQGLSTGLANGIAAADPALFVPVTNALGTQLGAAMSLASQPTQPPGGVGPVGPAVPGMGETLVQGLATGLTDSITNADPAIFTPVGSALGTQLGTALNTAMQGTQQVQPGLGGVAGQTTTGIGAQMVTDLATGLSDSITNAPEEVFTPVGAALGTKMTEALQTAVESGSQGGDGAATGVGQQMGDAVGQMLISGVEQADWAPVGTSLSTKLGETLQTVATENGDISTQLGDSVGQMLQTGVEGADFAGVGDSISSQLTEQMDTAIADVASSISEQMSQVTEAITQAVEGMSEAISGVVEEISSAVEEMASSLEGATESVSAAVEEMTAAAEEAGAAMQAAAEEASAAAEEVGTAAQEAAAAVSAAMQEMAAAVQAAAGAIAAAAGQIVASFNEIAGAAGAAAAAAGAVGGMAPAGGGTTGRSLEAGQAMVEGTAKGMEGAAPMVARSAELVADVAYDSMADAIQMGSPARRFEPVGASISQGMMKGMLADAKSRLKSAMGKMAGQVQSAMGKIKSAMSSAIGQVQSRIKEGMARAQGQAAAGGQAAGKAAAEGSAAGVDSASDENSKAVKRMWRKAVQKLLEGKGEMRFLGEEFAREFWLGMLDTSGSLEFAQFVTDEAVKAAENAIEAIRAKLQGLSTQLEIITNQVQDLESELADIDSQLASLDAAAAEEAAAAAAQARLDAAQALLDAQRAITDELEKQFSAEFQAAHQAHIAAAQNRGKGGTQQDYEAKLAKAQQTNSLVQQSKAMEEHLANELEMIRKAIQAESEARAAAAKESARAELEARRAMLAEELAAAKAQQAEILAAQHAAQVQYTQTVIAESQKRIDQLQKEKKKADSPEERANAQAEIALEKQKIELANLLAEALERQANAQTPEALAQANAQVQYYTEALAALDEVDIGAMLEELVSKMGEVATSIGSAATAMDSAAAAMTGMSAPATEAASSMGKVSQATGTLGQQIEAATGGMFSMGAKYHEVMDKMAADGYAFQEKFKAMTDQQKLDAEAAGTAIGTSLSTGITDRITQGGPALQQAMVDGLNGAVTQGTDIASKGGADIATAFGKEMHAELGTQFPELQTQIRDGLQKPIDQGITAAEKGGTDIGQGLMKEATTGVKDKADPFKKECFQALERPIQQGIKDADKGGNQIGNALGDGMIQGVRDRTRGIADEAARTVREAINAAKREADARSPSQETRDLGHDLGDGLILGMHDRRGDAKDAAENLVHIPRLSPTNDGGVTGGRARNSGNNGGNVIHIGSINLPGVTNPQEFLDAISSMERRNGVSSGRL